MMAAFMFLGTIFEWLVTTKIGRIIGLVGAVLILLLIAFLKVKAMGRAEERERSKAATDKLIKKKETLDADVADDSDSAHNARLRRWTRG